jgi:hypothetical protein
MNVAVAGVCYSPDNHSKIGLCSQENIFMLGCEHDQDQLDFEKSLPPINCIDRYFDTG